MKKFLVSMALVLALLTATLAQTSPTGSPNQLNEKVDKLFAQWDKPDSPGCALGVIKDGKFVYKRGYGAANLDYNAPLSLESVFYIASTSNGLGAEEHKGLKAVAHGGGFMGFRTEMICFPKQRFTVICLCNAGAVNPGALARQVADLYLADQIKPAEAKSNNAPAAPSPRPSLTLTAEQLAEYTGAYYSEELDETYRIVIEDGMLLIKARNAPRVGLVSQTRDEFRQLGMTFGFVRNDQRQITGFALSGGRAKGIQFVRKAN